MADHWTRITQVRSSENRWYEASESFLEKGGKDGTLEDRICLGKYLATLELDKLDEKKQSAYLRMVLVLSRETSTCELLSHESYFKMLLRYFNYTGFMHGDDLHNNTLSILCNIMSLCGKNQEIFAEEIGCNLVYALDDLNFGPTDEEKYEGKMGKFTLVCLAASFTSSTNFFAGFNFLTMSEWAMYVEQHLTKNLPPNDTAKNSWDPPRYIILLLMVSMHIARTEKVRNWTSFVPAMQAFYYMKLGSPFIVSDGLFAALLVIALTQSRMRDGDKERLPPIHEIADKIGLIVFSLLERYIKEDGKLDMDLFNQERPNGYFDLIFASPLEIMKILLMTNPTVRAAIEPHFIEGTSEESRGMKPRCSQLAQFMSRQKTKSELSPTFASCMFLLSDCDPDMYANRFGDEACAEFLTEYYNSLLTLSKKHEKKAEEPIAQVHVHEDGEEVPGSLSVDELTDRIREIEKDLVPQLTGSDDPSTEVDEEILNRIMEGLEDHPGRYEEEFIDYDL